MGPRRVVLAAPRGFCAGVVRAVDMVEDALLRFGAPVYVRRAIVHNPHVVARLEERGAVVVREVDEVPPGGVVVFSAHGVAQAVRASASARGLSVVDATCPFVARIHRQVQRFVAEGYDVVLVGHPGHDEVIGTRGQAPGHVHVVETPADVQRLAIPSPGPVACVTQTTLNPEDVEPVVRALRARFPRLAQLNVDDVCLATRRRQSAVRRLAAKVDVVLVLGDSTSSNSQRLREIAAGAGRPAYLIGTIADLQPAWLEGVESVGLAAGASTPEPLIQEAAAYFQRRGATLQEEKLAADRSLLTLSQVIGAERAPIGLLSA